MIEIKITNPAKLPALIEKKTGRIFVCIVGFTVLKWHWCFEQSNSFMCSGYTDSGEVPQKNCDGRVSCSGVRTCNCMSQKLSVLVN